MTKWEYLSVIKESGALGLKIGSEYVTLEQYLNSYGEKGWQLCHMHDNPMRILGTLVFKREVQDD